MLLLQQKSVVKFVSNTYRPILPTLLCWLGKRTFPNEKNALENFMNIVRLQHGGKIMTYVKNKLSYEPVVNLRPFFLTVLLG